MNESFTCRWKHVDLHNCSKYYHIMSAKNVQFSVAVHMMAALGHYYGKEIRSEKLASSIKADPSFVRKTLSKLAKAGLVVTARGRYGACSIARRPEEITLLEIYQASGAPTAFAIHDYPVEMACPTSVHIKPCLVGLLDRIQASVEETLSQITLAEVVTDIQSKTC